jgi:hypothetical protein
MEEERVMDAYTFIRVDENLRNAIHKAYGKKCFYCGEKINMHQLEIDHIIPKSNRDILKTSELENYLNELETKFFVKDCIANYLPSCRHCNNQKSDRIFSVSNLRYFHEQAHWHSDKVIKFMERFKYIDSTPENEEKVRLLSEGKEYFQAKTIEESSHHCIYAYGLGQVRVNAFLPMSIHTALSCLLLFKQNGLSDCMFSYDEDDITNIFFNGYKTGITSARNFIWYINERDIAIKLPNCRFNSTYETAEQLSLLFDDLYEEFYKRRDLLLTTIGATYYEEGNKGEFAIVRVPKNIWIAMVDFAQEHDRLKGNTKWDIFHPLALGEKNAITIGRNHLNKIRADIYAKLYVKNMSGYYVDIIWQTGFAVGLKDMEGFDDVRKWRVDYTHDWILNKFIPYVFYYNTDERNIIERIYKKKVSFEEFSKEFDYHNYRIESLCLSE